MKRDKYRLGGRTYVSLGISTLDHDIWFRAQRRRAGLVGGFEVGDDESPQDAVNRLVDEASKSRRVLTLLGGLLVPQDVAPEAWTPLIARQTGRALGRITDEREKAQIQGVLGATLLGFFLSGELWFVRSRNSSTSETTMPTTPPLNPIEMATATRAGAS